jgi:hypothetical protein
MDQFPPLPLSYVRITEAGAVRNGKPIPETAGVDASGVYRALGGQYPKFFKMDSLSKWGWLGAEALLMEGDQPLYEGIDLSQIAVVIHTTDGCLEVDKRYAETLQNIPSPALFVYTLPNIMLGEICIRHGFTGEQLCRVVENFDAAWLLPEVRTLLLGGRASHCLFGKVDATDGYHDVCLFWADSETIQELTAEQLQVVYERR